MRKLSKLLLVLSFALSITSSAFAVTVASWGGAYTESQKLGYGDPTAKKSTKRGWQNYVGYNRRICNGYYYWMRRGFIC